MQEQNNNKQIHGLYSYSTPRKSDIPVGILLALVITLLTW